jgi:hypothetical protein
LMCQREVIHRAMALQHIRGRPFRTSRLDVPERSNNT